jgi:hypothetical protein
MSRIPNPFSRPGRWYRGVFHCHTTNSDGAEPVESAVTWYADHGYDFVAITDHNQLTRAPARGGGRPLLLPGAELDVGRSQLGEPYHLVAVGLRQMIDLPRESAARYRLAVQEVIRDLRRAGAVVFVAHPYWSGLVVDDLLRLDDVAGIEVWNANTELDIGKGYSGVHWDDCLSRRKLFWGVANDDTHWRMNDYGRAWTMVRAEALAPGDLVQALEGGSFYASTGVALEDVTFDGDTATVRVGAPGVQEIRFICDGRWGRRVETEGEPLREASHTLRGRERYLRIEAVSRTGERAWTNPLFLER